jgi:hypothetical protein
MDNNPLKEVTFTLILSNVATMKVNVKFSLEQATKLHKGSEGIALLFL